MRERLALALAVLALVLIAADSARLALGSLIQSYR